MDDYSPYKKIITDIARASIEHGITCQHPLSLDVTNYDPALQQQRATFVTLEREGQLRGCIGMLQAVRPLIEDINQNAFAAAFQDNRFSPVTQDEAATIDIHVSILSPPTELEVDSEENLIATLRPGIDGLILNEGYHRSTFLPSVWEQLPGPREFLSHLKQKAGLRADYWSDSISFLRYTTQSLTQNDRRNRTMQ